MKARQLEINLSRLKARSTETFARSVQADRTWDSRTGGQHPALAELARLLARRAAAEFMLRKRQRPRNGGSR